MAELSDKLAALTTMDKSALGDRWAKLTGRPIPKASAQMLRLAVAYELQSKTSPGLPRKIRQRLNQAASRKTTTQDIRPGMRLAREYGGKLHVVAIGEKGEIIWNEREWRSLSEVARAITGTRWSGPAFFGLKKKASAA
ncbi:DUF2924 domain-containing protein [Erythrobacter litoralis]|uniref:DUF2924 domain-containing protein n=1 Tax=Erythrobacter litoralis TaxID=39960 RepID=UPI002435F230|nr:DUF2924 domain-containing protein [Erythrobacter litoralis]MDG6078936.1 DUF2924 domain-containing protein [Erythrobacter litoralis]